MMPTTTIEQKYHFNAKPVEVYDAYVNPVKHAEFTGAGATGKAEAGAEYTAWDGYITGKHVELILARKIVDEWKTSGWPEGYPPSRLELSLAVDGDGTELTMMHSEVPEEQAAAYRQGWVDYYWEPMRKYFEKQSR